MGTIRTRLHLTRPEPRSLDWVRGWRLLSVSRFLASLLFDERPKPSPDTLSPLTCLVGNEPDQYNSAQRDLSTWGVQEYVSEFEVSLRLLLRRRAKSGLADSFPASVQSWSTNLTSDLDLAKPFFQAGAFCKLKSSPFASLEFSTPPLPSSSLFFCSAKDPTSTALLTTSLIVDAGIADGGLVKTFSQHVRPFST